MKDRFQEIVEELGKSLDAALHVDHLGTCTLLFDDKLEVQLEVISNYEMIIASPLCPIPPGKFRENILLCALKANQDLYPQIGALGFSEKHNQLALFTNISLREITGEKLAEKLAQFVPKAMEWKDSIELHNAAPNLKGPPTGDSSRPFGGIKP